MSGRHKKAKRPVGRQEPVDEEARAPSPKRAKRKADSDDEAPPQDVHIDEEMEIDENVTTDEEVEAEAPPDERVERLERRVDNLSTLLESFMDRLTRTNRREHVSKRRTSTPSDSSSSDSFSSDSDDGAEAFPAPPPEPTRTNRSHIYLSQELRKIFDITVPKSIAHSDPRSDAYKGIERDCNKPLEVLAKGCARLTSESAREWTRLAWLKDYLVSALEAENINAPFISTWWKMLPPAMRHSTAKFNPSTLAQFEWPQRVKHLLKYLKNARPAIESLVAFPDTWSSRKEVMDTVSDLAQMWEKLRLPAVDVYDKLDTWLRKKGMSTVVPSHKPVEFEPFLASQVAYLMADNVKSILDKYPVAGTSAPTQPRKTLNQDAPNVKERGGRGRKHRGARQRDQQEEEVDERRDAPDFRRGPAQQQHKPHQSGGARQNYSQNKPAFKPKGQGQRQSQEEAKTDKLSGPA